MNPKKLRTAGLDTMTCAWT